MGDNQELLPVGNFQFVENAGEVVTYRCFANAEPVSNILVSEALADECYYLPLSSGESSDDLFVPGVGFFH